MNRDYNHIYQKLLPALGQLEAQRLELKAKGTRTGSIAGGICCLIGVVITVMAEFGWPGLAVTLIISLFILFFCISVQTGTLTEFYKKDIITTIITDLCPQASYAPGQGINQSTFQSSGLFHTHPDRYRSEDLITGQIEKTTFACSEIVAEEKRVSRDSKGNTRTTWVDIFRGFFFIADFQKDFRGRTVIYRNSWVKLNGTGQRVKLENPEFEKSFDVYSSDQIEARYLITPGFMEKLIELDRKFPGKITVSFLNSKVIIAIPDSTDHFETSIWTSQLKNSRIKEEFHTVGTLFDIIDDLNLNLRIWTKE